MGCGICLFAEKRHLDGWALLPAPLDGFSFADELAAQEDGRPYVCPHPYRDKDEGSSRLREWFEDRNYYLYGMLAGVRSYDAEPIDNPRGIPSNASPEYKAEASDWNGFSHSYFTVFEIYEYLGRHETDSDRLTRFRMLLRELETCGNLCDIRILFFFSD